MTHEEAEHVRIALAGSYEGDHDVAVGACQQAADELSVISQAMAHGAHPSLISAALLGVEERLRATARLAGALELADDDDKPEAAQ